MTETKKDKFLRLLGLKSSQWNDGNAIKKAYRKRSLKYHPDKIGELDLDDEAQKKKYEKLYVDLNTLMGDYKKDPNSKKWSEDVGGERKTTSRREKNGRGWETETQQNNFFGDEYDPRKSETYNFLNDMMGKHFGVNVNKDKTKTSGKQRKTKKRQKKKKANTQSQSSTTTKNKKPQKPPKKQAQPKKTKKKKKAPAAKSEAAASQHKKNKPPDKIANVKSEPKVTDPSKEKTSMKMGGTKIDFFQQDVVDPVQSKKSLEFLKTYRINRKQYKQETRNTLSKQKLYNDNNNNITSTFLKNEKNVPQDQTTLNLSQANASIKNEDQPKLKTTSTSKAFKLSKEDTQILAIFGFSFKDLRKNLQKGVDFAAKYLIDLGSKITRKQEIVVKNDGTHKIFNPKGLKSWIVVATLVIGLGGGGYYMQLLRKEKKRVSSVIDGAAQDEENTSIKMQKFYKRFNLLYSIYEENKKFVEKLEDLVTKLLKEKNDKIQVLEAIHRLYLTEFEKREAFESIWHLGEILGNDFQQSIPEGSIKHEQFTNKCLNLIDHFFKDLSQLQNFFIERKEIYKNDIFIKVKTKTEKLINYLDQYFDRLNKTLKQTTRGQGKMCTRCFKLIK